MARGCIAPLSTRRCTLPRRWNIAAAVSSIAARRPLARLALLRPALDRADVRRHALPLSRRRRARSRRSCSIRCSARVQLPGEALALRRRVTSRRKRRCADENARLKQRARRARASVAGIRAAAARRTRSCASCSTRASATPARRSPPRCCTRRATRSRRRSFVDKGSDARHQRRAGGDRRDGVVGQVTRVFRGIAEVTLHHRQGPRGAGAGSSATACARCLRHRRRPARRSCASWRRRADIENGDRLVTSGIDGIYPPGLPVAQVANVERDTGQMFARIACTPLAGVDRSTHLLVLRPAAGAAAAARRAGRRRRREEGRRASEAQGHDGRCPASALTPRRRTRSCWPVEAVVHRARRCLLGARCSTCCRWSGRGLSRCEPDFVALVLLYWCIQEPRYVGSARPGCSASSMDVADAHAVRPARARLRGARLRRPNTSAAACCAFRCGSRRVQVAVLLAICATCSCCSSASSAARRCRAGPYFVPPLVGALLWPLLSVAAAVAAAPDSVRRRTLMLDATLMPTPWPGCLCRPRADDERPAAALSSPRAAQRGARAHSCSAAGWRSPVLVLAGVRALLARFFYLQVVQHEYYQTLAEANRIAIVPVVPNRGLITDRNGIVLAQNYSAYTLEITPAQGRRTSRRRSTSSRTVVEIAAARPQALPKLLDESKNFESLPIRTRLTDEEVARFAVNRYRFPGVEIKARLFRQYPLGRAALARGRLHRPHQRQAISSASSEWDETANYKGSDYIGKVGIELSLRARAARHDRRRGGRGRRRRPRGAHAVAHAAGVGQQPDAVARHQAAGGRRERVRRSPRRAGRDRAGDRRRARVRLASPASIPNLFVDGIDPQNWEELNESPDKPLLQSRRCAARIRRARRSSRSWRSARSTSGKRTPDADDLRSRRTSRFRRRRTASATTSPAATAPSTCTSRSSCRATPTTTCSRTRPSIDDTARFMSQLGFGQQDRHRHRGRADRRAAVARMEAAALRRQNYRESTKWYLGDTISRRHRPGLQRVHADAARARDRDARQRRRRVSGRIWCKHVEDARTGESARSSRKPTRHARRRSPSIIARRQERAGRRQQGRHRRARVRRRRVRQRRQDRHRAGVFAQEARSTTRARSTSACATTRCSSRTRRPTSRRSRSRCWWRTAASARRPPRRSRAR